MRLLTIRSLEVQPRRVAVLFVALFGLLFGGLMLWATIHERYERRFDQLRAGMTTQEVIAILGKPDDVLPYERSETWQYRGSERVDLDFRDGRLSDLYAAKSSHSLRGSEANSAIPPRGR